MQGRGFPRDQVNGAKCLTLVFVVEHVYELSNLSHCADILIHKKSHIANEGLGNEYHVVWFDKDCGCHITHIESFLQIQTPTDRFAVNVLRYQDNARQIGELRNRGLLPKQLPGAQ